jgi:S-adenosyl-L-methionine hydrolase (adenosine-forming)
VTTVTLLSDLGSGSSELASLKGRILTQSLPLNFLDISHDANRFDYLKSAFLVKGYHSDFPQGTMHVIAVDPGVAKNSHVLTECNGISYLAPDNGILPMILEPHTATYYRITDVMNRSGNVLRDTYLPLLREWVNSGCKISEIADPYQAPVARTWEKPQILDNEDFLRFCVLYTDSAGNAHTNIERHFFEEYIAHLPWQISLGVQISLRQLDNPDTVPPGNCYAAWNNAGFLYIGMAGSSAVQYLGLRQNRQLTLQFVS